MAIDFDAALTYIEGARQFLRNNQNESSAAILHGNTAAGTLLIRRVYYFGGRGADWYYHPYLVDLHVQAKFTLASYWAQIVTANADWGTIADQAAEGMITYFFSQAPNQAPTTGLYPSRPFINQTSAIPPHDWEWREDPFTDLGRLARLRTFEAGLTFTNGITQIPWNNPNYGQLLDNVYAVFDGDVVIENRHSPITGTEYGIDYWIGYLYAGTWRGSANATVKQSSRPKTGRERLELQPVEDRGTIKLLSNYTGTLKVIYTISYSTGAPAGIQIGNHVKPYDLRVRDDLGSSTCKIQDLWWALKAFGHAYNRTRNAKWIQGYRSIYYSLLRASVHTETALLKDAIFVFKTEVGNLRRQPGTQFIYNISFTTPKQNWHRDGNLWAAIVSQALYPDSWHPPGTAPRVEFQRSNMNLRLLENHRLFAQFKYEATLRHNVNRNFVYRIDIYLKNNSVPFTAHVIQPALATPIHTINLKSFFQINENILWYPGISSDGFWFKMRYSQQTSTVTIGGSTYLTDIMQFEGTASRARGIAPRTHLQGFPQGLIDEPPTIYFRSAGAAYLVLTDENNQVWYADLPNTGNSYTFLDFSWNSFYNINTRAKPVGKALINWVSIEAVDDNAIFNFEIVMLTKKGTRWDFNNLSLVEENDRIIDRMHFIFPQFDFYQVFRIGNIYWSTQEEPPRTYQPGLMPHSLETDGTNWTQLESIPPGIADQSPYFWYVFNQEYRFAELIKFLRDSRTLHAGLYPQYTFFAPYFLWDDDRSALPLRFGDGTVNQISMNGPYAAQGLSFEYNLEIWVDLANILFLNRNSRPDLPSDVIGLIADFLDQIDEFYTRREVSHPGDLRPPTDFDTNTGLAVNYDNPCVAAKIGIICIAALYRLISVEISYEILEKCLDYLATQYIDSGIMAGSWAANQTLISGELRDYWGEWHSYILLFYCYVRYYRSFIVKEELLIVPGEFPYEIKVGDVVVRTLTASVVEEFTLPKTPILKTKFPHGSEQRVKVFDYQLGGMLRFNFKTLDIVEIDGLREFDRVHGGSTRPFKIKDESIPLPTELIRRLNRYKVGNRFYKPWWQMTAPLKIEIIRSTNRLNIYKATIEVRQVIILGDPLEEVL